MLEDKANQGKEKIIYFELCRVIAIFCIMYQHTGARGAEAWMYTESSWVYTTSIIGNIIGSIGVPMFWMVSGALLLSKNESWKNVYARRLPRIAGALIIFSVVKYFYMCMVQDRVGSVGDFFQRFYTQRVFVPYWFLYEYLGILLLLPFLRKMIQNLTEQEERILFILILGWNILDNFSKIYLGYNFILNLHIENSLSYFIMGYLMEHCLMLRRSDRRGLWFHLGQAVLMTGGLYAWVHGQRGLGSLLGISMLLAISVYYLIRYIGEKHIWNSAVLYRSILWCGRNVFGIFLIEDYLRNGTVIIYESLGPYITAIPACCIWLLSVFLIGNILVAGARKLPLLRKIL